MSIINVIKGSPLFFELFDEEIEAIVEDCSVLNLEENDFIFK